MNLYWRDIKCNNYKIANLIKEKNMYYLTIYEEELKKATRHGCIGIGNINFLQTVYKSEELFPFFKERIPSRDNPYIDKILKEYNLTEYDEMKLLEVTHGVMFKDRYYLI